MVTPGLFLLPLVIPFALFSYLDTKPIVLRLYWVPGHLDTDTSKAKGHVHDVHFALNHCADHFAGLAVKMIDHPMHIASGVLHYCALVQKIQRRMVRVIISLVEKHRFKKKTL